jgi:hypothetical protein
MNDIIKVGDHEITQEEADMLVAIFCFMENQKGTPTPLPPSIRDLVSALNIKSTSTVVARLKNLALREFVLNEAEWRMISRASTRLTYIGHHIAWTLFRTKELCE